MEYEHRMMRCKLDRSARIGDRRYRPGELLQEGHKPTDDFEEFVPKVAKVVEKPVLVRLRPVAPPLSAKVIGLPKEDD